MEPAKRIISAILCATLLFTIAIPAFAEGESTVNWKEFFIVTQPQSQTVTKGDSFTLSVEVNAPAGVEVEYQWKQLSDYSGTLGTEASFVCGADSSFYPFKAKDIGGSMEYRCTVTGSVKDSDGNVIESKKLSSDIAVVTAEKTKRERLKELIVVPLEFGITNVLAVGTLTIGFGFLIAPVTFLIGVIDAYTKLL